ncbi:MAG: NHL repeat-containing protein [Phycisphaerales bacterium]|nr:NHL repeat-containing protein [Phycisphaerales bacterium]MCB9855468.1 NHL repeat-containing protein [Phycisphaerales bacterium]MCB9864245.1 NHL repeat-containing protein [Phycisphaerales bacterium]
MTTNKRRLMYGITALSLVFCFARPAQASPEDTTADAVVGQNDFISNQINQGGANGSAATLSGNRGLVVDPDSGRLFVADSGNNRVLSWPDAASFMNGDDADLVFGQADFTGIDANRGNLNPSDNTLSGPRSVAVDSAGRLYIADSSNIRILRFDPPFSNGMSAVQVFGQAGSFTTANQANSMNAAADNLGNPDGIAVDADDNLYLADRFLHRVFIYNTPASTDTTADVVLGQPDFTSAERNQDDLSPTPKQNSFNNPIGVGLDATGNLYVADEGNNRVLLFEGTFTNNQNASAVYGQASFTTDTNGASATSMFGPVYVAVDPVSGNLYVADAINNRILEFQDPQNDTTADRVFGQAGSFTTHDANTGGVTADTLSDTAGVAVDPDGNLYAGDRLNNRVLRFNVAAPDPGNGNSNGNSNNNANDNGNANANDNTGDNTNDNTGGGGTTDMPCGDCGAGMSMAMPMLLIGLTRRRRAKRSS